MSKSPSNLDSEFATQSVEELQLMQKRLESLVEKRLASTRKDVLKQIEELVAKYDLSLEEVTKAIRTTAKRGKAPPIFRSPENWRVTWSGKGEAPEWYTTHPDPESLRIPDE
jgi:DNA-binding protein H-NS